MFTIIMPNTVPESGRDGPIDVKDVLVFTMRLIEVGEGVGLACGVGGVEGGGEGRREGGRGEGGMGEGG